MKKFPLLLCGLLCGCMGMADYLGPPPGAAGAGQFPVDPEAVRVDAKLFPKYHVASVVTPPKWTSERNPNFTFDYSMVDILPSDEWFVRHVVGDLYLIESASYNARQWKYMERIKFSTKYILTIYVSHNGEVSGGWKFLQNPKMVVLSSERKTYFVPPSWGNKGWENIRFEKMQ